MPADLARDLYTYVKSKKKKKDWPVFWTLVFTNRY